MNILIGEAGGTKTDWRLITPQGIQEFTGVGLHSSSIREIQCLFPESINARTIAAVYYYGAGLRYQTQKQEIKNMLARQFSKARIEVHSDVLAAARCLYGDKEGYVGLLGTGSGFAHYDGKEVTALKPSLGYLLGDEGSGAYIGKMILRDFLRAETPLAFTTAIKQKLPEQEKIVEILHSHNSPNAFLASITYLLSDFQDDEYVSGVIEKSFHLYIQTFIPLPFSKKVSFVGSVAWYFQSILKKVAEEHQLELGKIERSPIDQLVHYHNETF